MTLLIGLARPVDAQASGSVFGVVGGWTSNEAIWQPEAQTEKVGGLVLGGFLNAATPAGWFMVRAEAAWTQRGSDVTGQLNGEPLTGGVRSDYLSVSIHGRTALSLGRASLFVVAGPTIDQLIRSRIDPTLAPILFRDIGTLFGVGAGVGVAVGITEKVHGEIEVRIFEGLGDAYSGDFISLRNRSVEVVARVGTPLRR